MVMLKSSPIILIFCTFISQTRAKPLEARGSTSKRGVAFENGDVTALFGGLTWGYNWLSNGFDTAKPHFEYVPMLHADTKEYVDRWTADVREAVKAGAKHVLSFNEPDQCGGGGACMQNVTQTVLSHKQHVQPLLKDYPELRIGAPAVTNGKISENGTAMGVDFLEPFIKDCEAEGVRVDFIVAHWFDTWPTDKGQRKDKLQYFKDHMEAIRAAGGGRNLWVTEFGIWTGDALNFLQAVLPWLEKQEWIERYAFHYATPGVLVNSEINGLTPLGQAYAYGIS